LVVVVLISGSAAQAAQGARGAPETKGGKASRASRGKSAAPAEAKKALPVLPAEKLAKVRELLLGDDDTASVEAAKALATKVQHDAGADRAKQATIAFKLVLQRSPERAEQNACLELLQKRSLPELCRVLLNLNEFLYVD